MNILEKREKFEQLNDRSKMIFQLLREHEALSQESIMDMTGLSKRVIRYNIGLLREAGFIKSVHNMLDMRGVIYKLRD